MNLAALLDRYRDGITEAVIRAYPPIYNAEACLTCGFDLRRLLRRPLGAQADAVRAAALSLRRHRNTNVVGEMGTGKSFIAASAASLAGCRRILILAPPHLVKKWGREILQTVPDAKVAIVRTIRDLERTRSLRRSIQLVICSREQAKTGLPMDSGGSSAPGRRCSRRARP